MLRAYPGESVIIDAAGLPEPSHHPPDCRQLLPSATATSSPQQAVLDELEQIRLNLLMQSDDPDAALHATRNICTGLG